MQTNQITITKYNASLSPTDQAICNLLKSIIDNNLPGAESKI